MKLGVNKIGRTTRTASADHIPRKNTQCTGDCGSLNDSQEKWHRRFLLISGEFTTPGHSLISETFAVKSLAL